MNFAGNAVSVTAAYLCSYSVKAVTGINKLVCPYSDKALLMDMEI